MEANRLVIKAGTQACVTLGAVIMLAVTATVLTPGCGRKPADAPPPPDLRVHVQDAQGVGAGAAVQWRGVEVGRVDSVTMDKGLVRVDVMLHPDYRGKLHEGVRARPARGLFGRGPASLDLYGGDDTRRSVLNRGSVIAEASMTDAINPRQMKLAVLVAFCVILFFVVLRLMRKITAFALAAALLVFAGWFVFRQWQKHGEEFNAVRMEMTMADMARTLLTQEAAQEAWITVQGDLAAAIRDAGGFGKDRLLEASAPVRERLAKQADELQRQGQEKAAEEVRKLIREMIEPPPETP